ncbi:Pectate lyase superfamily protein [uncultured Caudovirales phage]|uniref:Pectate lyase superfamily protein n=1 Tax=uncultured Caudovirales phage TaxID=2100421 RepID=A0A6J7X4Z1_9CAUD|nr:Pectate lyase superfamily protein [uncultured Caudovirales phage]
MSALSINVPYPVFSGKDGLPLDNGYVWIGTANLYPITNPIAVYFDEALTIQATQPLRTINGFISNAGTPAQVYVDAVNFSILVQDSKGSMVYNFPDGTGISANIDSCDVTYDPPFTGGVAYHLCQKLEQIVSFKDFGAVGDGVADDTAAIQAAITALSAGGIVDGQSLTYRVDSTITGVSSNTRIQNATFNFSQQPDIIGSVDRGFYVAGSIATGVSLTSNTVLDSNTVAVTTSSFAVDDLVFLKSTSVWDSSTSTTFGQYARVKSIDSSTQLSLYDAVLMPFNTANAATIAKVTPVKKVVFDNVNFIGANNLTQSQNALYFEYGEDCTVSNCKFEKFDYLGVGFFRCYASTVSDSRIKFARNSGNAYGYGIFGGSYACTVANSWGEDCRHTVTVGDNDGINMFTKVIGCHATSSKDAGFDSHSASMYTEFIGNTVEMSNDRAGTSNHDGLIIQGLHAVFIGNTVVNQKGAGISCQPLVQVGINSTVVIEGNTIFCDDVGYGAVGGNGIYCQVSATYGANFDSIIIKGNKVQGGLNNVSGVNGIYVYDLKSSTTMKNVVIEGNIVDIMSTTSVPLYIRTATAATNVNIQDIVISNNILKTGDTTAAIITSGNASAVIKNITGANNILESTTTGWNFNSTVGSVTKIRFGKNIYNTSTNRVSISDTAVTTDVLMDDSATYEVTTITNATNSTFYRTDWYVFNRAGTVTVTLPDATVSRGRLLRFKTIQAQAVDSASSNVVPIDSATAGTAILPATDGAWCQLYCDGTNWVVMARG